MKKLFIAILCVLPFKAALAQKDLLAFDEHNKYIYYQVVEQPGLPADTMRDRALYFLKIAYPRVKLKKDKTAGNISGDGKIVVYAGVGVLKHEEGEMHYTYAIECKDQKYRYWLTNFVFTPYKTDRYGKSVPADGVDIALESASSKLDKKQADNYIAQTGAYSKQFGDQLKQYMLKVSALPPKEVKRKVISTKDW